MTRDMLLRKLLHPWSVNSKISCTKKQMSAQNASPICSLVNKTVSVLLFTKMLTILFESFKAWPNTSVDDLNVEISYHNPMTGDIRADVGWDTICKIFKGHKLSHTIKIYVNAPRKSTLSDVTFAYHHVNQREIYPLLNQPK